MHSKLNSQHPENFAPKLSHQVRGGLTIRLTNLQLTVRDFQGARIP